MEIAVPAGARRSRFLVADVFSVSALAHWHSRRVMVLMISATVSSPTSILCYLGSAHLIERNKVTGSLGSQSAASVVTSFCICNVRAPQA